MGGIRRAHVGVLTIVHATMMVTSITRKLFRVERTSSCRIYQELAGKQDATNYAGFRSEVFNHPPLSLPRTVL